MFSKELQQIINSKFDDDVLIDIVKKKTGWDQFDIESVDLGEASTKGDNYLSNVTRFTIKIISKNNNSDEETRTNIYVICKSLPQNLATRKTFRSLDFFVNEIAFYSAVRC